MMRLLTRLIAVSPALLVSNMVFAQAGGTVTYGPGSTSVPVMGGGLLIVLAALLGVVAMRMLKAQPSRLNNWLIGAVALSLISAAGGIKLISDAVAAPASVSLTDNSGGQVVVGQGASRITNVAAAGQFILDLDPEPGCTFVDPGVNGGGANGGNVGGGIDRGTCSDNPSTYLAPTDYCDVQVTCGGGT